MPRKRNSSTHSTPAGEDVNRTTVEPPRIIGGKFRGRKLIYNGRLGTRPMKERTREALFNLLGPAIREKHAIDLFAGTGALALESLSRGASTATMIEQHFPTARTITENIEALEVASRCEVITANTFAWAREPTLCDQPPWVIFCSPPYSFYTSRLEELLQMLAKLVSLAPPLSMVAVEADEQFDFSLLPRTAEWDVRTYRPAVIGILYIPGEEK